MAAPKLQVDQPLSILVSEGGKKVFERSFTQVPITIGRSLTCDVPLSQYNWISRQHFQITLINGRWVAVDLNSSNGLQYGGQSHSQLELEPGMALEIGPLAIRFQFKQSSPTAAAPRIRSAGASQAGELTDTLITAETTFPKLQVAPVEPAPAVKPLKPQAQARPSQRSAYPPPHPVTFRQPHKGAIASSWFERTTEKVRFTSFETGVQNLRLNKLADQIERTSPHRRALEIFLTWKDQVYDSRLFFPGETIGVGTGPEDLYAPILKGSFALGRFDGQHADFYLGKGSRGMVFRTGQRQHSLEQLLSTDGLPRRGKHHVLSLSANERCVIDLGADLKLNARYIPAPRQLSKATIREPDQMLRKALTYSGTVHIAFLLVALLLAPATEIPKVKHLSPRVAKLLTQKKVEPPTPPPPPKEEPPPEPPKTVEKVPPPPKLTIPPKKKIVPPPKRVVVKNDERLKVINKLPPAKTMVERSPQVPPKAPEPDLNQMGALAALGALGAPTVANPKNMPVAINVNPNAGGQTSPSTSGMIGAVKATGGKLQAAGMAGVKTKGSGYGTGTGYGVQGLKGMAGSRGVGGAVVGSPKLMDIAKEEGLTQKQVMDVVKQHVAKIQHCYERSLLSTPNLSGRVEYEWEIAPQGQVKWAKVKRSDIADGDGLNGCVTDVFKKMKFPAAKNGLGTTPSIGFPFGRL